MATNQQLTIHQETQQLHERIAHLEWLQQQNELIFDATDMLIVVTDPDGRVLRFNQACVATTGFAAEDVIGQYIWDILIPPEEIDGVRNALQQMLQDQLPNHHENDWLTRDGGRRRLSWTNTLARDEQGKTTELVCIARDVTNQRQQEQELRMFQALVENASDAIAVVHADTGNIAYYNEAHRQIYRYRDNQIGQSIATVVAEEDLPKLAGILDEIATSGVWQGVLTHVRQDGETFLAMESCFVLKDDSDTPRFLVGLIRDVSEQQQQEDDLRMFKALVENASDAISIVRAEDGCIIYTNLAHREMYRCDDTHIGQPIATIVAEQDLPQLAAILDEIVTSGSWKGHLTHVRHDGETFPAMESCFSVKDSQGKALYMVGFVRDMSDHQRAEAERTALQQQIIDAQRNSLRELSTPLIPITDDVVIMPLIGSIDSARAQQVMETLLEGVSHHRAQLVILDITGVQVVDTQVAQAFIQAAQAVRLLGAQVMLTGIQPQIAQTLVQLGVDLSEIATRGSLQAGIAAALT